MILFWNRELRANIIIHGHGIARGWSSSKLSGVIIQGGEEVIDVFRLPAPADVIRLEGPEDVFRLPAPSDVIKVLK